MRAELLTSFSSSLCILPVSPWKDFPGWLCGRQISTALAQFMVYSSRLPLWLLRYKIQFDIFKRHPSERWISQWSTCHTNKDTSSEPHNPPQKLSMAVQESNPSYGAEECWRQVDLWNSLTIKCSWIRAHTDTYTHSHTRTYAKTQPSLYFLEKPHTS